MHTNRHFDATAAHMSIQDVLPNGQIPRLAETRRNAPLKDHRRRLEELLEVLDGIRSYGDEGVRRARADVVEQVEGELHELKRKKAAIWDKTSSALLGPVVIVRRLEVDRFGV
ncbi:hypothetical protein BDV93DRAFT_544647 [Ceratobasidium sp. AG-I]|nr:hypothetical protein BDV93DRAFT_544647 [Ceratobasidium sp. AG-I]